MPRIGNDPRNGSWEKALEENHPDCRVRLLDRGRNTFLWGGRIQLDKFFCASCGAEGGGVPPNCPFIFYLCDRCAHGIDPPGTVRVR